VPCGTGRLPPEIEHAAHSDPTSACALKGSPAGAAADIGAAVPGSAARLLFANRVEYGVVTAAAAFRAIPLIVAFFIFQRQVVEGIALTGLKM
jgi:hypothetical protein